MHSGITPRRLNEAPSLPYMRRLLSPNQLAFQSACALSALQERAIWASAHPARSAQDGASRISLTSPGNRTIPDIESRRRVQRPAVGSVTRRARPMGPTPALRGGATRPKREADHACVLQPPNESEPYCCQLEGGSPPYTLATPESRT
ncbi:hypothetical protein HPB50_003370 [Hyalomma asiaticum]|uniref:Uncharacterized protein n=1 Tax=Hyalomma asiaticum TaxID=266040 RepID=A0ACB7TE27_HYAAI|nr:hypothetical protein HPB50_003370 [Hyalomma asiaticum]